MKKKNSYAAKRDDEKDKVRSDITAADMMIVRMVISLTEIFLL